MPIPTFIALLLSFKNINDGMLHPINLVIIAIATIKPARNNTATTCVPMIAKNKGAKIISNLDTYSPICLITLVLATAMPTEKAPTIGDSPINAAKKDSKEA